jgi:hypothetical protein
MSVCVAGVALRDIPMCFITCQKPFCMTGRGNTFASLSEDDVHFSWQAQNFGGVQYHFAWQQQHFIDVWCCVFFANRIARADNAQIVWQAWAIVHLVQIRRVWNVMLPGKRSIWNILLTLYTCHSPLYSTLYTPHSTLYTLHFTLYTSQSPLYTLQFTLHTPLYALHSRL